MASYSGDARDANRARTGARVQEEMKEAFDKKVLEMRQATQDTVRNMNLTTMFATEDGMSSQSFASSIIGLQSHDEYANKVNRFLKGPTSGGKQFCAFLLPRHNFLRKIRKNASSKTKTDV